MTRLFNKAGWIVAGVLGLLVVASITGVVFGGPLNPPGPPTVPTGKTQINALPFTISAPGSYIVNADLTCPSCSGGGNGIMIAASQVTLDLQGFALRGPGAGSADGITVSGTQYDIEIRNGLVTGWAGRGVELRAIGSAPNSRVHDMRVSGNGGGIGCTNGDVIQKNIVAGNATSSGIVANGGCEITDNTISGSGGAGIATYGSENTITNNTVTGNNVSFGSDAILVGLAAGDRNWIDGNRISANGAAHAITVSTSFNTITRNFSCFTTGTQFNITGANNTYAATQVGPTAALGANPWANIACA